MALELDADLRRQLGQQTPGLAKIEYDNRLPAGFRTRQVHPARRKPTPTWAQDEKRLRHHIFAPAMRRYRIAELYWLQDWSAPEIASELGLNKNAVEQVIRKLRKKS